MQISKPDLRTKINKHFDLNEFKQLCFDLTDLGVEFDNLEGPTLILKIQALISFLDRRGELSRLVDRCGELRPKANWREKDSEKGYFTYCFRAECNHDIDQLYKLIYTRVRSLTRSQVILSSNDIAQKHRKDNSLEIFHPFPDMEVQIETTLSLSELRGFMRQVEDGHIMAQTVAHAGDYTGERNYEL